MDMKFPRGRRTQLKKSWKFLGIGAGKQWSPWNGAESWKVGVKLNKTSVGCMNIIKCSKYWKDWNHEAYFQPNIQNYPNNPSLPLYWLALLVISTTSKIVQLLRIALVCQEIYQGCKNKSVLTNVKDWKYKFGETKQNCLLYYQWSVVQRNFD